MSNAGHRAPENDPSDRTWLVWVGMPALFIGFGLLTVAVVELASNKSISAVTGLIGGPLVIIGFILLAMRIRLQRVQ